VSGGQKKKSTGPRPELTEEQKLLWANMMKELDPEFEDYEKD
jgi:hypothetical protein